VEDGPRLGSELARLLSDPGLRAKIGEAGYGAVAARHGAVSETLDLVSRFLVPGDRP